MRKKTIEFFSKRGISIDNIGAAGGFQYTDKSIQESINAKFESEMKITAADNEVIAAQKFAKAAEAIRKQKELDVDIKNKEAEADAKRKWNGSLGDGWTLIITDKNAGSTIPGGVILGSKK